MTLSKLGYVGKFWQSPWSSASKENSLHASQTPLCLPDCFSLEVEQSRFNLKSLNCCLVESNTACLISSWSDAKVWKSSDKLLTQGGSLCLTTFVPSLWGAVLPCKSWIIMSQRGLRNLHSLQFSGTFNNDNGSLPSS